MESFNWYFLHFISASEPEKHHELLKEHEIKGRQFQDESVKPLFQNQGEQLTFRSIDDLEQQNDIIIQENTNSFELKELGTLGAGKNTAILSAIDYLMAKRPAFIRRLFGFSKRNRGGVASVFLHVNGQWVNTIVDNQLPFDAQGRSLLPLPAPGKEWAPVLLTKAVMKAFQSGTIEIENLSMPTDILTVLTGLYFQELQNQQGENSFADRLSRLASDDNILLVTYNSAGLSLIVRAETNGRVLVRSFPPKSVQVMLNSQQYGQTATIQSQIFLGGSRDRPEESSIQQLRSSGARFFWTELDEDLHAFNHKNSTTNPSSVVLSLTLSRRSKLNVNLSVPAKGGFQTPNLNLLIAREKPHGLVFTELVQLSTGVKSNKQLDLDAGSYILLADFIHRDNKTGRNDPEFLLSFTSKNIPTHFGTYTSLPPQEVLRRIYRSIARQYEANFGKAITGGVTETFGFYGGFYFVFVRNDETVDFSRIFKLENDKLTIETVNLSQKPAGNELAVGAPKNGDQIIVVRLGERNSGELTNVQQNTKLHGWTTGGQANKDTEGESALKTFKVNTTAGYRQSTGNQALDLELLSIRLYIERNVSRSERVWQKNQTGIFAYSFADATGYYLLFDNQSKDKILREKIVFQVENLKLVGEPSEVNSFSVQLELVPETSHLIALRPLQPDVKFSYSHTNRYQVMKVIPSSPGKR